MAEEENNIKCPLGCGVYYDTQEELNEHIKFVKEFNLDDTQRVRANDLLDGVCF